MEATEMIFDDPRPGCHPPQGPNGPIGSACNRLCEAGIQRCPRHAALDTARAAQKAAASQERA